MNEEQSRKILTIDGGGIKGVFPASFLNTVEEVHGSITDYFDMIVGTSTGGIIALGLGLGLSAQEILTFYEMHGPSIFKGNGWVRILRQIGYCKNSNNALKSHIYEVFGQRKLGESKVRLVIPSMNLENGEVYVYKTAHHNRFQRDYKEQVVNIALATSAAPTYFPTHRNNAGTPLIDGGVWANNPMGMAVVEAIGVLNWSRDNIKMLSLGCTNEVLDVKSARNTPKGLLYWADKVTDVFMSAQSSSSLGTAQLLIGHDNVTRIDPFVSNNRFKLDDCNEIDSLKGLGDSEARKSLPKIKYFFEHKAEEFIPEYSL